VPSQLCFAVRTTCLAPKSSIDRTHWSVSSFVGLNCAAASKQFLPYVAMLKWTLRRVSQSHRQSET
jgi:hypothetical protein